MRDRWVSLAVAATLATAAATISVAMPASADLVTSCTGSASDLTVPNDLFVPAGQSCELTNITINGNTIVRAGANLLLTDSRLTGSLLVQGDGFVSATRTTVTGATRLHAAFGGYAEHGSLANVIATDSGFLYGIGTTINNIVSTNGETFLESVRLNRSLSTTGDRLTDVYNSVIQGTVGIISAHLGSVICASEIDGDTSLGASGTGPGAVLQIGASAPLTGCPFNVFGGDLALTDNVAPIYLSDNVIRGSLRCTGNSIAPVGSSTRIRGTASGQCAAPAANGTAGTGTAGTSTAFARKAERVATIRSRMAAGTTAVARSGPASLAAGQEAKR